MFELYSSQEQAIIFTVKFAVTDLHIMEESTVGLGGGLHYLQYYILYNEYYIFTI